MLGLKGSEWAAELLGPYHPLSQYFKNLSPKIKGYFLYKGQDEAHVFLEHIASGKKFNLYKKSFDHAHNLVDVDSIIHMGIVKWMEEWWFSGIVFTAPYNADLILDEKNSITSRKVVNFLDYHNNKVDEVLADQLMAFNKFNDGSQIAFMKTDKVEAFIINYMEFYNKSLNRSEKEYKDARARARKEGFFGHKKKIDHQLEDRDNALVFFNPKSGTEIALDIASAFPAKDNPFYNQEESEQAIITLILSEELSPELVMFFIDNYKHKLPFFQDNLGKLYVDNIDFILRFAKRKNYFTKPEITFAGGPK